VAASRIADRRAVRLQACLNGSHLPSAARPVPATPAQLAGAARAAVDAGAEGIHMHPKEQGGRDDLAAPVVGAAVAAVAAAVPRIEIGVTTGAWAVAGGRRLEVVRTWAALPRPPDVASVNWHEEGSPELASVLLEMRVGVEAGLWTPDAARAFSRWPRRRDVTRVLVEATDHDPDAAIQQAASILAALAGAGPPELLVHGEEGAAWPVLRWAAARGYAVRIGLEDCATRADGAPAGSSVDQVTDAVRLLSGLPD
jgi:uncharacterized protein (DUF849 family)